MTTRFSDHLLTGTHAARPAATAVPQGTLYSCTTDSLIYQSSGTAWSTYATLGGGGGAVATDAIWDAKGDLAGGTGANTAARLAVGTNGQVLTADSAEVTGLKWAAAAGGSSGYDLDTYSIDATYGHDFTGAALPAAFTRRNFTSAAETYQLGKNATYIRIASTGRAVGDGYLETAPAGDWEFAMALVARWTGTVMPWGIAVVDSAGTGVGTCFYNAPNAFLVGGITTYSTYGGTFQQCPSFPTGSPFQYQMKMWQRLRKSGTNYYASYSLDGEIWSPESPAFSSAITVDRVGMLIHPLGGVGTDYVDVDWFNKIA